MPHYNQYRVRKGFRGKAILQQWHCFPEGILSPLSGTCNWADVNYNNAPTELINGSALVKNNRGKRKCQLVE